MISNNSNLARTASRTGNSLSGFDDQRRFSGGPSETSTPVPQRTHRSTIETAETPIYAEPANPNERPISGDSGIGVRQPTASTASASSRNMGDISTLNGSFATPQERPELVSMENRSAPFLRQQRNGSRTKHSTPRCRALGHSVLPFIDESSIASNEKLGQMVTILGLATEELETEILLMQDLRSKVSQRVDGQANIELQCWVNQYKQDRRKIEELESNIDHLTHELNSERREKADLTRELKGADKRKKEAVQEKVDELEKTNRKLQEQSRQVADFRWKNEELKKQLEDAQEECKRMEKKQLKKDDTIRNNAKTVSDLRVKNNRLKEEIKALRDSQAEAQVNNARSSLANRPPSPQRRGGLSRLRSSSVQNSAPSRSKLRRSSPPPVVQRTVRIDSRATAREISPEGSRPRGGCLEGCLFIEDPGPDERFKWTCAYDRELVVKRNPKGASSGAFQFWIPGVGKAAYYDDGQLGFDWDLDGVVDESTIFLEIEQPDGSFKDARVEVRRDDRSEVMFRETWTQNKDGEWIGSREDANNEVVRRGIPLAEETDRRNTEINVERKEGKEGKDRVWRIAVEGKMVMLLQNHEFLRFKVPVSEGFVQITVCRCGQKISEGVRLPDGPGRTAFNVKHVDGNNVVLCEQFGECLHVLPVAVMPR